MILLLIIIGVFLLGAVAGWFTHHSETQEIFQRHRENRDLLAQQETLDRNLRKELAVAREEIVDVEKIPDYPADAIEFNTGRYGCPAWPADPNDWRIEYIRKLYHRGNGQRWADRDR